MGSRFFASICIFASTCINKDDIYLPPFINQQCYCSNRQINGLRTTGILQNGVENIAATLRQRGDNYAKQEIIKQN